MVRRTKQAAGRPWRGVETRPAPPPAAPPRRTFFGLPLDGLAVPRGATGWDVLLGVAVGAGIPLGVLMLAQTPLAVAWVAGQAWPVAQVLCPPLGVWFAVTRRRKGSVGRGAAIAVAVLTATVAVNAGLLAAYYAAAQGWARLVPMALIATYALTLVLAVPLAVLAGLMGGGYNRASRRRLAKVDPEWERWGA